MVWQDVLDYWFAPGAEKKWFQGGPQVDKEIQEKFGAIVSESKSGARSVTEVQFYVYVRHQRMKGYNLILLK